MSHEDHIINKWLNADADMIISLLNQLSTDDREPDRYRAWYKEAYEDTKALKVRLRQLTQ